VVPIGEVCPISLKQNKRQNSAERQKSNCLFRGLPNKPAGSIGILERNGVVWPRVEVIFPPWHCQCSRNSHRECMCEKRVVWGRYSCLPVRATFHSLVRLHGTRKSVSVFSGGLTMTPKVLPASCRQIVLSRIVSFLPARCRQHAKHIRKCREPEGWKACPTAVRQER